jgi:hypothetical protein
MELGTIIGNENMVGHNGCGLKVVAASKPTNFQPTTNLVGRIHFPKPKSSHPFNLLLPDALLSVRNRRFLHHIKYK